MCDQWLVLRGVRELKKREKKTSYLSFLDVSKVYDSLWREGLWCKMGHYGVEEKFVKVCEGLYSGVETRVVMNRAKSKRFGVERGQARRFGVERGQARRFGVERGQARMSFCLIFI